MILKQYNIWFQGGHIMMTISARSNKEAREMFNRMVSIKLDVKQNNG